MDYEATEREAAGNEHWSGTYFSNNYQYITDEDATNIADALERALDDIPEFDTDEKLREYSPDKLSPAIDYFSGKAKQQVEDFMTYCRAGGFVIG